MKLIIAGSRTIDEGVAYAKFMRWMKDRGHPHIEEFVTGACPSGPDQVPMILMREDLEENGTNLERNYVQFSADWNKHGKAAGPIRNKQMAEYADALLLIWDGKSRGSANMKFEMEKLNKPVYEIII